MRMLLVVGSLVGCSVSSAVTVDAPQPPIDAGLVCDPTQLPPSWCLPLGSVCPDPNDCDSGWGKCYAGTCEHKCYWPDTGALANCPTGTAETYYIVNGYDLCVCMPS